MSQHRCYRATGVADLERQTAQPESSSAWLAISMAGGKDPGNVFQGLKRPGNRTREWQGRFLIGRMFQDNDPWPSRHWRRKADIRFCPLRNDLHT
jgi:hypothetical protein